MSLSLMGDLIKLVATESGAAWWGRSPREGKLGPWSTMGMDNQIFPGSNTYDDPKAAALIALRGNINYRIDRQKIKGSSGHKLNVEGYQPTPIKATFRLYTPLQWAAFLAFLPQINPKLKINHCRRIRVKHPVFAAFEISEVFINDVEFPQDAGRMIKDITLTMEEVWDLKASGVKTVKQANVNDTAVAIDAEFVPSVTDSLTGGFSAAPTFEQRVVGVKLSAAAALLATPNQSRELTLQQRALGVKAPLPLDPRPRPPR